MSTRYLVPCPCGKSVPVAASEAGGSVACPSCEAKIEVPRLRELRDLPLEAGDSQPTAGGWSFRLGVLTTGIFLTAALAGGAAWFASNEPPPPAEFNAAQREQFVEKNLEVITPKQLWDLHNNYYLPMEKIGLQKVESPRNRALEQARDLNKAYQAILKYAAAAVAGLSVVAFALLPK